MQQVKLRSMKLEMSLRINVLVTNDLGNFSSYRKRYSLLVQDFTKNLKLCKCRRYLSFFYRVLAMIRLQLPHSAGYLTVCGLVILGYLSDIFSPSGRISNTLSFSQIEYRKQFSEHLINF